MAHHIHTLKENEEYKMPLVEPDLKKKCIFTRKKKQKWYKSTPSTSPTEPEQIIWEDLGLKAFKINAV